MDQNQATLVLNALANLTARLNSARLNSLEQAIVRLNSSVRNLDATIEAQERP